MNAETILRARYPKDVVDALLDAYREIEANYVAKKWKASELDAGHFVEAVRRILEFELMKSYTPVSKQLSRFNNAALGQYENASGDESYRMLIPRALYAVYGIRNKRGVGHVAGVSPNEMDATFILYTVKWVLAELVRLVTGASIDETQKAIDEIVERRMSILWKHGDLVKVLDTKIKTSEELLILLYDRSPQTEAALQEATEYKSISKFRKLLADLHKKKLIHRQADGQCLILPPGFVKAEQIIHAARLAG